MRISYLPIFLAVATSMNSGSISAEQIREARQTLLTPLLELNIPGLLTSVLSMVLPSEVSGVLSERLDEVFSKLPLDLSMIGKLASLDALKALGRKKRSLDGVINNYSRQKITENIHNAEPYPALENRSGVSPRGLTSSNVQNLLSLWKYESEMYPERVGIDQSHTTTTERKRRSNDEEGADVQTKATETVMRGVEMMQKGLEGSKMAAEAGSDLAQSGKAGAEGLASGAAMMGGAAETMAAGAGQVQGMLPG